MIAVDNALGCVGIAPNVASALATSYNTSSIPNAIIAAIAHMDFGDVLHAGSSGQRRDLG